jgi:DNA-binding winged helix-turn-helix (wHTH) protein/class 3 adenylate cyclase/tetratricopeptide (TPR) repeat protein
MQYRFGDYILDTQRQELQRAGTPLKLRRKVLQVLTYLLAHHDRLVSKHELLEQVWPDQFVGDEALKSCIKTLRKALGEGGRRSRFIGTLHGQGYRFVAAVSVQAPLPADAALPALAPPVDGNGTTTREVSLLPLPHLPESVEVVAQPVTLVPLAPEFLSPLQILTGERLQITVLCGTLADITVLADRLGFAALQQGVQTFHTLAQACMQQYVGMFQALGEDGFLALFGVLTAPEAHAERALQAALALQQRLRDVHGEYAALSGEALTARLSVHTGWVLVGSRTAEPTQALIIGGDTTQGAVRLQTLAAPGTILVSETTLQLLRGAMQSEAYGLVRMPGHAAPLMAYTIVGMETLPEARTCRPFVGRQRELITLDDLLVRVLDGQGQVVGIVGEPGMGKSRLLAEFQERLQERAVTVLEGYCRVYTRFVPYAPIGDLLRSACGLSATADPDVVTSTLTQTLQAVGMSPEDSLPYLLQLLVGQTAVPLLAQLTPEAIKERTFAALCQFHLRSSQQRPLLLVVENLHWIDPTSEAYLASLVDRLIGTPILLLTSYRPGYRPPWMDKSYATQLSLPQLTREESVAVVRAILPAKPHTDAMVALIVAKAEGNPLFLEELAHAMREQDNRDTSNPVPETIQAVLAARIEQLPESHRRVLRTAAVLGREVPLSLLAAVWEEAGDITPHLHELMRLELLYARAGTVEPVYLFKHVLTQEVAYEGLLLAQRQALHATVGRVLEARFAGRRDEVVDRLAYHYARTDDAAKAVAYLTQVADRAARGHAHAEALAALHEALPHAERLLPDGRDRRLIELILRQADSLRLLGRIREALSLLQREQTRLERLHDPTRAGPYYFLLGYMSTELALHEQAPEHLQQALAAAIQCNDATTMGKTHYALASAAIWKGHYPQGVAHSQQAIDLLEPTPERYWLGLAYYILGSSYWYLGELALAQRAYDQVRQLGEALGDRRLQSYAAFNTGRVLIDQREYAAAITVNQQALALATDPRTTVNALFNLGRAYLEHGEVTQATPVLEQAARLCDQMQNRALQGWVLCHLSRAYLLRGDPVQALDLAGQGLALARAAQNPTVIATALRTMGRLALAQGALVEAETHFQAALQLQTATERRSMVGVLSLDLAQLAHAQGDPEAVATHLHEALTLFSALQLPKWVEHTTQLASELGVSLTTS